MNNIRPSARARSARGGLPESGRHFLLTPVPLPPRTLTGNQSQLSWEGSLLEPPALLDGVTVVIISPRKPVTVGTVARACGSFECEDLRIVMPRQESYITRRHAKSASKGAQYILYRAAHYDSIAQATADCEVRIAFTRWSQASSPHVFKVDISSLADHPAVHDVITQPLKDTGTRRAPRAATATADNGAGAGAGAGGSDISSPPAPLPSRPTPATWSAATAAAAEAAEVRLAAASVLSSSGGSGDDENEEPPPAQQPSQQQQQQQQREALATSSGWASTGCDSRGTDSYPSSGYERNPAATSSFQQPHHHHCHHAEHQHKLQPASSSDGSSSMSNAAVVAGAGAEGPTGRRPPRVALVFGREELGMSDEEVDSCEESLSLSHAVSIALCTLYQARLNHLTGAAGEQAIAAAAAAGEAQLLLQPHLHVLS
ncbi:hypothetical protein VOLCADRAFT_106038 [Volvox carteri f. nagariensis]|uniref:Uncharacterized protein n=1 Tax=Volvox carteri f. nagariensis TaxID=3068 RepID=D8U4P6_VOLCA|nr:uncharacterized protein VOLCADRAFT_106038 [Volvox carteri f. nagariensis]EFJ45312.1 hypothetical protein VOLCADRAFT_106038 [Volvox carteri f. nagariensis]|eukprot:XP_002953688.1 hypothetical protein VOLCADRAFT_106038 [Volvox carteri f. nagariensis]